MERASLFDSAVTEVLESILNAVCNKKYEHDTLVERCDVNATSSHMHASCTGLLSYVSFEEDVGAITSNSVSASSAIAAEKSLEYKLIDVGPSNMDDGTSSRFQTKVDSYEECDQLIKALMESLDNETIVCSQTKSCTNDVSNFDESDLSEKMNGNERSCDNIAHSVLCDVINEGNSSIVPSFETEPMTNRAETDAKILRKQSGIDDIYASSSNAPSSADHVITSDVNKSPRVKLKLHPVLQIVNMIKAPSSGDPTTPECSDNFAELNLNPLKEEGGGGEDTYIPVGWLSTLSNRKQRNHTTTTRRGESRQNDFVYCGSERTERKSEEIKVTECSSCLNLRIPEQASDISLDLLSSGIATTPGSLDKDGHVVLIFHADDILWQKFQAGSIALARLLLYLTSRLSQASLVLDLRNASVNSSRIMLETLSIFQNNNHMHLSRVMLLSNDDPSFLSIVKAVFEPECVSLRSIEDLIKYIELSNLPPELGGSLSYSHTEWINNRLLVDSFLSFCENIRHNFAKETLTMTSQSLPPTTKETRVLLNDHHKFMSRLLDDKQVTNLRKRGQHILQQLADDKGGDAICCAEWVQSSYRAANDAVTNFVKIADDRLLALEQHLLIKQFEQSCDYIHHWSSRSLSALKDRFDDIPDTIEALRSQRSQFDNFYFSAMTEYAKCDCLLSEVEELNQLGYLREAELIQRAKITQDQVKELLAMVERKKEEIEAASQMYKFIDQAYSWALDGMKFVAMLNMEDCLCSEACQQLLDQFDLYMKEHPVIIEESFKEIFDMAHRYCNLKCLKQCEFAERKCKETSDLFRKRRELIVKAKAQATNNRRMTSFRMKNREKLEKKPQQNGARKSDDNDKTDSSIVDEEMTSSECRSSVGDVSIYSGDSSVLTDLTPNTLASSSSGNNMDQCDNEFTLKTHNPKPARKILKKSSSMPGNHLQRHLQSHVHSKSGVTLTIGSPVHVEEQDTSGKSKMSLIIEELISTEREYVKSLNYVIENYFPEMCRLDIPQVLRCKRNIIFGNIEKIAQFHSGYFLRDLEKCEGNPAQVAKAFQMHRESFGLYALYSKNKPQSDQLLQEHGNEFFKKKQLELDDKMDLASYLLKPVQRMGKYALLLHAMAKRAISSDERSLKDTEELVKYQLRHGNDLLTMDSIQGCDVNLKEQGSLLRQEEFLIYSGRRKIVRRVFLFEDLILFSKPIHVHGGHDVYQYKCSYKTAEIGMTENIGETGFKFEIWFRRRRPQASQDRFVLQSSSHSIKRMWVEEIRGLLWKQALRNRDHRKMELSSMGVGSKPHLDITVSSENRIVNRSVITSPPIDRSVLADRLMSSRTRASIAVSNFDHGCHPNKRPHSTISTSSSTSSVGSGNNHSGSIISSLTLASWSNRFEPRSSFSPPAAYCDFHSIAEDPIEECESNSESSLFASSQDDVVEATEKPATRQYVTTPNQRMVV